MEVSTGDPKVWEPARLIPGDKLRWRFIWSSPPPGHQTLRFRAIGLNPNELVETSINVMIDPTQRSAPNIADPYASTGRFYKGELHGHSTWSFDGWNSMPPAQFAEEYRRLGFDWVSVTDHDVVSNADAANSDSFAVIPGFESTTDNGHIVGLFMDAPCDVNLPAQGRIDAIRAGGGLAILAHPGWRVSWTDTRLKDLSNYTAIEIFNGVTSTRGEILRENIQKWHEVLKARGRSSPVWAVAVDDAHEPSAMNRGWVMAKLDTIKPADIKRSLETGAFYASNGPGFSALGVMDGAIAASSRNAATIRFIDQDLKTVGEGSSALATYRPTGRELFVRVEAQAEDGSTAWSQPFFIG